MESMDCFPAVFSKSHGKSESATVVTVLYYECGRTDFIEFIDFIEFTGVIRAEDDRLLSQLHGRLVLQIGFKVHRDTDSNKSPE